MDKPKRIGKRLSKRLSMAKPDVDTKSSAFGKQIDCGETKLREFQIQNQLKERKNSTEPTVVEKYDSEKEAVERQLELNNNQLSALLKDGNEIITNIQIANDKREINRRNKEAEIREELLQKLQRESIEAQAKFENISSRWSELDNCRDPMGIYEGLEYQRKRIDDLMKQKDAVIEECRKELDAADLRYVIDQEKQSADIYCLAERIDKRINIMKKSYREHLQLLEEAIDAESDVIHNRAVKNWEEMYMHRQENEKLKFEKKKTKTEHYANEMLRIVLEHDELTRATRIRLEKDNEDLQLELEKLKGNVLINSDKFDYNFQVLQKREDENVIIRNQQKRRVTKLNGLINSLKKKHEDTQKKSDVETKKLTDEISSWRRKILDLEEKADVMMEINDKKYQNIWKLNEEEAVNLLNKVLAIDKLIHEQQLGLDWEKPTADLIKIEMLTSYKNTKKTTEQPYFKSLEESLSTSNINVTAKKLQPTKSESVDPKLLRTVLKNLGDHTGFLIDQKINDLIEPYTEIDQRLVRLDNVFYALGVKRIENVLQLRDSFMSYAFCPTCYKNPGTVSQVEEEQQESTEAEADANEFTDNLVKKTIHYSATKKTTDDVSSPLGCSNHYFVINRSSILTALREFLQQNSSFENNITTTLSSRLIKVRSSTSRLITTKDVQKFWQSFQLIVSSDRKKIWDSLEIGLMRYIEVLKKREKLGKECTELKRQNTELRFLMQRYITPGGSCSYPD